MGILITNLEAFLISLEIKNSSLLGICTNKKLATEINSCRALSKFAISTRVLVIAALRWLLMASCLYHILWFGRIKYRLNEVLLSKYVVISSKFSELVGDHAFAGESSVAFDERCI